MFLWTIVIRLCRCCKSTYDDDDDDDDDDHCCRYLRQQVESRGLSDVDLGPDEQKLRMASEAETSSSQQREIEKLRDELTKKQAELDALKRSVS